MEQGFCGRLADEAGDAIEVEVAGHTEDEGDSEDEEGGGEGAEDEVFRARLEGYQAITLEADEDIESDRDEFDAHEQEGEIIGGGGGHHAGEGEELQRVIFRHAGGYSV